VVSLRPRALSLSVSVGLSSFGKDCLVVAETRRLVIGAVFEVVVNAFFFRTGAE